MSTLLLDLGNTRLKWALWDSALGPLQAQVHQDRAIDCFLARDWPAVQSVWIAAVPRLADRAGWTAAVQSRLGLAPRFAESAAEWRGLRNAYAEPQRLGIDRWLAMVALWAERPGPFAMLSAGTALTFDRVDARGQHLGGLIAPGFGQMLQTLRQVTAVQGDEALPDYGPQLGRSSVEAIRQGAWFAAQGVIAQALSAPGAVPDERLVVTGGDAELLKLGPEWQRRPGLVLEGLSTLATMEG